MQWTLHDAVTYVITCSCKPFNALIQMLHVCHCQWPA